MRWRNSAAVAALFLAGATGICVAQTVAAPAAGPSVDDLVGKKLTAIDGSSLTLSPAEGGMAREIATASGGIQRTYFAFINDRLGTVADANDIKKITGVFRRLEGGFEVEYADGSTETLALNPGGGLTLETISTASAACTSWYPEGHVFSVDDRKAALAAFAVKLGLADDKIQAAAKQDCGGRASPAGAKPAIEAKTEPLKPAAPVKAAAGKAALDAPKPALIAPVVPPVPSPKPVLASAGAVAPAAAPTAASVAAAAAPVAAAIAAAGTQAIEVRNSEIHAIDPAPPADPLAASGASADVKAPQMLASATPTIPDAKPLEQRGASTCLSVESDGGHWGFRNRCGYTVQFSYCLMAGSQLASCHDGAVAGSVAGNGFGALIADESLMESDARHEFRWVACEGGAGEVIPHLDQIDPPSGRCVR